MNSCVSNRKFYSIINKLTFLIVILQLAQGFYEVPSYYGHFNKRFFDPAYINSGTFTYFQYHYQVTLKYNNSTLYMANKHQHCIQKFDLLDSKKQIISGSCGKPGNVIGDITKALFNYPSSIVYYQYSPVAQLSQINAKTYIVANQTCNLSSQGCILSQPYPTPLGMNNIRISPQILLFPTVDTKLQQYLFITDQQNHCIKNISIKLGLVSVIAGQCGVPGFLDGPKGYNKLNQPSNIGITRKGIIYFYDLGNEYMRKINKDGSVQTLQNGACKFYSESRSIYLDSGRTQDKKYSLNNIICYENWIQKTTKSPIQHYYSPTTLDVCKNHIINC